VLDSFAGSGTTGAVAHKMGRRWIMVEMGEHADTLALPRLKSVVDGSDKTGVTKMAGWQGGGGFRYLTLADPLLMREPELGLVVDSDLERPENVMVRKLPGDLANRYCDAVAVAGVAAVA